MQLKEISLKDIKRNPEQPREHFDTDKLKELGESIKEVGLINPITVEKQGNKFEIIAGERRFRGSEKVNKKTIMALVKEYKSKGDKAVESLIENLHREDLTDAEKGKFLERIMEMENIPNLNLLSKRVSMTRSTVEQIMDTTNFRKKFPETKIVPQKTIRSTRGLSDKDRIRTIKLAEKKGYSGSKIESEVAPIIKKATPQIKEAILKDEITVDEAEDIKDFDEDKKKVAIK